MVEVNLLIEGGAAKAGAAIGGQLGPLGVNIQKILTEINKKTQPFKGLQVPVKIIVDEKTKNYEIKIGTPPISQLIKSKAKIEKGSGKTGAEWVGNITMEDVEEIAQAKQDKNIATTKQKLIKQIIGTCQSMGITINNKKPKEILQTLQQTQ